MAFLFDSDIDFSFAICPRRNVDEDEDNKEQQQICNGEEQTSLYLEYEDDDGSSNNEQQYASDEETTTSTGSCRSVTFAENPVSEVKVVPRYERERVGELFYNRWDIIRFKQERRLERMQVQVIW